MRLQKAQLQSAAAAFTQSTKQIDRDLEGIAARVEAMAAASNQLQGLDHRERDSFWGDMQHRFAAIARDVAELHSLDGSTRATAADLQSTSRNLGTAVNEVQSIELQLSQISLNAIVSASHLGSQGEGLHVIANAIRELQKESGLRSTDARAALESISEAIGFLAATGAAAVNEVSGEGLLEGLTSRVGDFKRLAKRAHATRHENRGPGG